MGNAAEPRAKPTVLLAFANDRVNERRHLRNLVFEERAIGDALEPLVEKNILAEPLILRDATPTSVLEMFRRRRNRDRISVFHFGGHAGSSSIVLNDESGSPASVHADGLADYLGQQKGLVLVFLNGCSTRAQVTRLRNHVPAVVATSQAIKDEVAANFARQFYLGLTTNPLRRAFDLADASVRATRGGSMRELVLEDMDDVDWDENQPPWSLECEPWANGWMLGEHVPGVEDSSARGVELQLPGRSHDRRPDAAVECRHARLLVSGVVEDGIVHWSFLGADHKELGRRSAPLEPVRKAVRLLETRGRHESVARTVGNAVAECLFGRSGEETYHAIFRKLHGFGSSEQPATIARPVACRIVTCDLELRRLPLRLAFDCGCWLVDEGWRFGLCTDARDTANVMLPNPCTTLLIAPEQGPHANWARAHLTNMREMLRGIWKSAGPNVDQFILRARSRAEIEDSLRTRSPHLVYVIAESNGDTILVDRGRRGTEPLSLSWLVPRLAERDTRVLYLAGPSTIGVELSPQWSHVLPSVVVPQGGDDPAGAESAGRSWLYDLLANARDPETAAHRVPDAGPSLRWAMTQVHVSYGGWKTDELGPPADFDEAVLRIDRRDQRSHFSDRVARLVREREVQVVSFIARGTEHDSVGMLGEQLAQHIESDGFGKRGHRRVNIERRFVPFPPAGDGLTERLEAELKRTIMLGRGEDPANAVLRMIGRDGRSWNATVVWLDWGQVGIGGEMKTLRPQDLAAWFRFGATQLPRLCPVRGPVVRIISTLAVGLHEKQLKSFGELVRYLRKADGVQTRTAEVFPLPVLECVAEEDLEQVLHRSELRCPSDLVPQVAHALVHASEGRYAAIVEKIRHAMQDGGTDRGWVALARQSESLLGSRTKPPEYLVYGDDD